MYRISELSRLNKKLFHTGDLAVLWNITDKNTLYTAIKRYIQKGVLFAVYKGLYSTAPIEELDTLELGAAIAHKYTYLSTESVLATAGVIYQTVYKYTFISDFSKEIKVGDRTFLFRKLKDKYLLNPAGITNQNGVFVADTERAAADLTYFDKNYHFDAPDNIDWQKINEIRKEVGYYD